MRVMARLQAIHDLRPLDLVLVSGDMTDAGRSTEWAEFLDAVARHPGLAERMIILPGNHDLNIVDRLNPARLDLPFSPGKRLRQMRTLSAIAQVQGHRAFVVDPGAGRPDLTLAQALAPHRQRIAKFADSGGLRRSAGLGRLWDDQFPMILPPAAADGLAVAILNSNAETHFSFTNALGMISAEQTQRLVTAIDQFPQRAMDHRAASSPDGISDGGRGVLRARRNRAHQRQLVLRSAQALRGPHHHHARPPAYRLDGQVRRAEDRLRPVAGDGCDE